MLDKLLLPGSQPSTLIEAALFGYHPFASDFRRTGSAVHLTTKLTGRFCRARYVHPRWM